MSNEYYYIEENEQKGPFTIEQLKIVVIKPDTLVWCEEFDNWKPAREIEELKKLLKKTPPPPPIVKNLSSSKTENNKTSNKPIQIEERNVQFWATFKILTTFVVVIGIIILLVLLFMDTQKKQKKNEIISRIDKIFDGKPIIFDGVLVNPIGELEETEDKPDSDDSKRSSFYLTNEPWWIRNKLYTVFTKTNGGFTINKLTKWNEGFIFETIQSGDMGYKKPKYSYDSWGYRVRNNRLSVNECYKSAFEFFTSESSEAYEKGDEYIPGSYSPGKYSEIINAPDIQNKYFYMKGLEDIYKTWNIDDHSGGIKTDDWIVFTKFTRQHYNLTEHKNVIKKDLYTILGIAIGVAILSFLIIFLSKPKYFKNLKLYGKRWQNTLAPNQILFFEHSFFKENTFVEIVNDKMSDGILKITDRGKIIELLYTAKSQYYKIEKVNRDSLILTSLKENNRISFVRVGVKQGEEIIEEKMTISEGDAIN